MISIRVAEQADLPALLQIYNEEVLHGTATFDLHPKTLAERQVWFDQHNRDNHPLLTVRCSIRNADQCSQFHEGLCKHSTFSSWIAGFQRRR